MKNGANFWLINLGSGSGNVKTVPLPPTLTFAAGISNGVSTGWTRPTDDGGSELTGYLLEQSTDQINWTTAATLDANTTNTTVNNLTPGSTYYFRVRAVNEVGRSDASNVMSAAPSQGYNEATGGTVTEYSKDGRLFRVHTFASAGSFNVVKNPNPFRVLLVGAGNDGGLGDYETPGGGGQGGRVLNTSATLSLGQVAVAVGLTSGQDSTLGALKSSSGVNGGDGGRGLRPMGTNGSDGPSSDITGALAFYAGGGGGGSYHNDGGSGNAAGGRSGGGAGGDKVIGAGPTSGSPGAPNTGGGGGGGGGNNAHESVGAGAGGSGIVIVSYEMAPYNEATGGQITDVDNYNNTGQKWRIHTFTGNDSLNVLRAVKPFSVVMVGGGGFGGWCENRDSRGGGGGGGGEVIYVQSVSLPVGNVGVAVGGTDGGSSVAGVGSARPGQRGGSNVWNNRGGNSGSGQPGGNPSEDTWRGGSGGGQGGPGPSGDVNWGNTYGGPGITIPIINQYGAEGGGGAGNNGWGLQGRGYGGGGRGNQATEPGYGPGAAGVVAIAYQIG